MILSSVNNKAEQWLEKYVFYKTILFIQFHKYVSIVQLKTSPYIMM